MSDFTSRPTDSSTTDPQDSGPRPDWKDKQDEVQAEAKQTAKRAGSLASDVTARKIDERKSDLRTTIENIASGLEKGEGELERSDLSELTKSAASQLRRFAQSIEETDGHRIIGRATEEARHRPLASAAAGAAIGFALARAMKATPQASKGRQYGDSSSSESTSMQRGAATGTPNTAYAGGSTATTSSATGSTTSSATGSATGAATGTATGSAKTTERRSATDDATRSTTDTKTTG